MAKNILTVTVLLLLVLISGCSGISYLKEDVGHISFTTNHDTTTKAASVSNIFSALPPDLTIEAITWSPEQPSKGDNVTFSVTVKNQGSGDAIGSRVHFYIDGRFKDDEYVGGIDAGGAVIKTFIWAAQAGSHTFKAVADGGRVVPESNEGNNEKAVTILTLYPDLIIESITWSSANPLEGDNITFTVTVKNQGSGRADYSPVAYYIDDAYMPLISAGAIDAGTTGNAVFYWIAQAGSHTFKAVADPQEKVAESEENNNEKTVTFPTLASDLLIQSITISPTSPPPAGGAVTFTVTIKNQGSARADRSRAYLQIDGFLRGSEDVQKIDIGESITKTFAWPAEVGSHTIKAIADAEKKVSELDENNNEKTVTFSGASPPDLIIESITWSPANPSEGDSVTFTVIIKNQGNGKAGDSYVAYYIDNTYLASKPVNPIDPSATNTKTFTWIAEAGYHTIKAVADDYQTITEGDEANNVKEVIYPVPPDLIIESITWSPAKPSESDNMTFTVTVKNRGNAKADSSHVAYYIDDTYIAFTPVAPVDPSATDNDTFGWTATAGLHTVKAVADPQEKVTEGNENNNAKTVTFAVSTSVVPATTPAPTPTPTPAAGTEAQEKPAGETKPVQLPEKRGWTDLWLFILAPAIWVVIFIVLLRSRQRQD
ncbi:CARDB domain-containing protein [Chloroflexota bacterium]